MKAKTLSSCILLLAVAVCLQVESTARAVVTFSVTPPAVSNTYNGTITLQLNGLTNTETVVVQKFLDLNTNGVIDAGDWLVQQFQLTDGQAGMVIGGIVNSNVPGDTGSTAGQITARLNFQNGDFVQNIAGQYAFKLSSPGGHFAPLTNLFSVTNVLYLQKVTGNVVSNGTSTTLPNAVVLLFGPPRPGGKGPGGPPLAGAVANNSGSYAIPAPPGTYAPMAFKNGYVVNFSTPPAFALGSGQTVTTNLTVTNATSSISGTLVDANNSSIKLPGVFFPVKSTNGLLAITFTDTNGVFSVPATAGTWETKMDDTALIVHGYLGLQNGYRTNAGAAGVTLAVPKATALFYGSVKDSLGNPLPGVDVYAKDNGSRLYESYGCTDANGNYSTAALGGLGIYDPWWLQISSDGSPTNYVFSQQAFLSPYGGTNVSAGTAVQADFTALLATNHITGSLKDDHGNPIAWVKVWAYATINGVDYMPGSVDTDASGNYWLNVVNGTWQIGLNGGGYDGGGGDRLPGNYLCPPPQSVVISNNNGTANFTALSATNHITGSVKDNSGNPIAGVGVYASADINGTNYYQGSVDTDVNGNYSLNVINGTWWIGLNNGVGGDSLPGNYVCPTSQSVVIYNNNGTANFTALSATNHITGSVKDGSGNPIALFGVSANATINGLYYFQGSPWVADTNGNYSLNVVNGTWTVTVNVPGNYVLNASQSVVVSNNNPTVNFTVLTPTNYITGTIKDDSGSPIAGAWVWANATINGVDYSQGSGNTDTNGIYSLNVVNGTWTVNVWVPDNYLQPANQTVVISNNNGTAHFTALLANNHITGSLKDDGGNSIAGVGVWANTTINGADYSRYVDTDSDGNYSLNVANGAWWVGVNTGGGGDSLPGNYVCAPNQLVVISNNNGTANFTALRATNHITGYLKDNSGNPIVGVGVWANATINGVDYYQGNADTDNNGDYSLNVANGTWSVSVNTGGGSDRLPPNYVCSPNQEVVIYNNNGTVNFIALPATNHITGSLKDNGGNPFPGVGVFAWATINTLDYFQYAETDTNGNYSMDVANGTWSLSVNTGGGGNSLPGNYVCPSDQKVVIANNNGTVNFIALPATNHITGSLKDNSRNPFPGVGVFAWATINTLDYFQYAETDTNGNYSMDVANGTWSLSVNTGGGGNSLPGNYVCPSDQKVVIANNNGTVNFIALPATNHITGSLKDNGGNPFPGVGVFAWATINTLDYFQYAETDTNGNYSMDVANGTWSLSVNTGGGGNSLPGNYVCPSNQKVVIANNNGTVNFIALPATNHITGSLKDNGGNPFAGVGISAWATINSLDYFQYAETDTNGNYSMGVANGIWSVSVNTGGGGNSLPANYVCSLPQSVAISNNSGIAIFTAFLAPNHITGRARQANGAPIGGLGMWASATINSVDYVQPVNTDADGTYSLNVANGSWTVGVACGSNGGNGLDDILGSDTYQCPDNQPASIADNNAVANFTVQPLVPSGPDVASYYVGKLVAFLQVDPTNFVLNTNSGPFNAYLGVVQSTPDVVAFADVILPTGSSKDLPWDSRGLELRTQERFPDQASIDAAYPPGDYDFRLYALHDELQFPVLSMPPAAYPNPPRVSNFAAAQSIYPLSPFTLQWDAIPGATTNDSLWVFATDNGGNVVFKTPAPSIDRLHALQGTATSVVIPTNTFQSGQAYRGGIIFFQTTSVDTSEYPGAAGITIVAAMTSFPLAMNSELPQPRLDQPARLSATQFHFQLSGVVGQNYTVQASTNLASTNWFTLLSTNLSASPVFIQDNQATNKQRSYRVKLGP